MSAKFRFSIPGEKMVKRDANDLLAEIAAGDAFFGAMTPAIARGDQPDQALRWSVAAACVTVTTECTALCDHATTEALFPDCAVEPV